MKISGYILKTVLTVLAVAVTVSCDRDTSPVGREETAANVQLVLSKTTAPGSRAFDYSDPQPGLTVRMDRLPASTRADEEQEVINDVWVLQFNSSGLQPIAPVYLSGSQLQSVPTESPEELASYKLDVSLIKTSECTLWFVGNTGNSTLFTQGLTLDDFLGMTIPVATESEVGQHINKASGYYTGAVDKSTIIKVQMYRLVSKISLNVMYDSPLPNDPNLGYLKLMTLRLKSVPKTISYSVKTGDDYRFPVIAAGDPDDAWNSGFMDYEMIYYDDLRNMGTVTWYVPENIRGVNETVTSELKKWSGTDPSWNSPRSYATHLVMEGDYEYMEGDVPVKGMAEVTIYPGDNVINDFNVARNSHYTLNAGITKLQGWKLADHSDPQKDSRVVVRIDPYITYKYYYEGEPHDDAMSPYYSLGVGYRWEDVVLGGSYSTTAEIRNAFKDRIPVAGDYLDGRVEDGKEPWVAVADNMENVVNIFYDKVKAQEFYVRYHPNYPDGSGDVIEGGTYPAGTEYQITPGFMLGIAFTGYSMRGYNTEADGSGTAYIDAQWITIDSDLDLYGQWVRDN